MSNPASRAPSGPTLSTSKSSARVVLCGPCTPLQACAPRSSRWIIVRESVEGPRLRRWPAAARADARRRHEAKRQERDDKLPEASADPDLLDPEPLAVAQAAIGDRKILALEPPGEALQRLRLPF